MNRTLPKYQSCFLVQYILFASEERIYQTDDEDMGTSITLALWVEANNVHMTSTAPTRKSHAISRRRVFLRALECATVLPGRTDLVYQVLQSFQAKYL